MRETNLEDEISNDRTLSLVAAAAAGAFAYHLLAKMTAIEQALGQGGHMISLSSLLDMATTEEEDKEEPPVGFSTVQGKLRRK